MAPVARPAVERFWEKVSPCPITGCYWWTGVGDGGGYSRIGLRSGARTGVHRFAWQVAKGAPPPDDMMVCHRCDQPACVNPDHLLLGSAADNMADRDAKGRQAAGDRNGKYTRPEATPRGEASGQAKLSEHEVAVIRGRYVPGRPSGRRRQPNSAGSLAIEFGVTKAVVLDIIHRRTWGHIA